MAIASLLIAASGAILLVLGFIHLVITYSGRLRPRDDALRERMARTCCSNDRPRRGAGVDAARLPALVPRAAAGTAFAALLYAAGLVTLHV